MSNNNLNQLKGMNILSSLGIFITASILLFIGTKYLIPLLSKITGGEIILFWFIVAGLGIFLPLIVTAIIILKKEGYTLTHKTWSERLRFKKMTKEDWIWTIGGIIAIGIFSGIILKLLETAIGNFDHSPPFMSFKPLSAGRYWLLAVWLPYWILNIMGEEILWRGVILPRQEITHGKIAWIIHSIGWGIFHIAFGWQLLITVMPIIFIQSYIIQKRKNSWIGVIIHGGINGPSFIAISFGLL